MKFRSFHWMRFMPAIPWTRRTLRALLLYIVTPYLALLFLLFVFQRRLIFQPTRTGRLIAADYVPHAGPIDDVELVTQHGETLHGWRFRSEIVTADQPAFLVIYFPGNAGCRRDRISDGREFGRLGCDVLLFDYRGYGDNGGSPSEAALIADAHRIWDYATGQLQMPPEQIVLFGESLGGGVATWLAAELSHQGTPPAALILNSTFASLAETAAWHYPTFPVRYLIWDRFPSVRRMPLVGCPVLQFHGTADDIVPLDHGKQLFAAIPATYGLTNEFVAIEDGQHNFITVSMMHDKIQSLLDQLRK